jgi:hypothetical protein
MAGKKMTDNNEITAFPASHKAPPGVGSPNDQLVELMAQLLRAAQSGELQACAFATYRVTGRQVTCAWEVGQYQHELAAAVMMLCHLYPKSLCED